MAFILKHDDCINFLNDNDSIKENSVDLFLIDLPYGQTHCKWDVCINLDEMWKGIKRTMKENALIIFFCTTKFGVNIINSNPKWFKYDIVWEKSKPVGFFNCNKMPLRNHEMIYVFGNKKTIYNPQKTPGTPYKHNNTNREPMSIYVPTYRIPYVNETGERFPKSIQKFSQPCKNIHHTQKPVDLLEWLIKTYSNEGDLVCDFVSGSGSTCIACINTKRNFIGCEKDEEIFKLADKRIKDFLNKDE